MSNIFSFASTNKITVVTKYEDREFTSYSFLQNIEPTLTTSASFQPLWKWNLQNNNNSIPLQFFTHIITSNNSDLYLILILIYPDSISFTSYDISKRTTFLGAINSNSYSFIESIVDIIYDNSTKYFILSSSSSSSHLMSSFLIPEHGKDHSIQLNNLFLKIDNTKKYIHHESILYTKIYSLSSPSTSTSSTSYLALISRNIMTGLPILEWCQFEITSNSILVIYEVHLPFTETSFCPLLQYEALVVACHSSIQIYNHRGLLESLTFDPTISSSISAFQILPQGSNLNGSTYFLFSTYSQGIYFGELRDSALNSRIELHSLRRAYDESFDNFPSKLDSLMPHYTRLIPLSQHYLKNDWIFHIVGYNDTLGYHQARFRASPTEQGPCSVISPRKTSFQGLFDQLTNVTHILSASSCSKGSLIFHDSFYACCSASLESQSASSALFNFHLGISLLLENFCPLEVPFSESSMNIFPISRDEIVLFFLSSRPLNETSILFSNSSNNIDLYSSSSDVLLDQYSLLVEVLHPKYLFQCTRNCFQVLDLYSFKRIPQTLTKFSNIHQCCKVLSDQEADHVSYFLLASDESLILYGLFGDRVRELFRKNIQDHVLSLSAILKSHHLLIAYTTINQGSTMCLVLNLPKDLSKGNWTEYRSFQLDFSVTDVMFLAQYLCIINHPLTKIAYLVTSCMDGRIVIFRVNFDSLELGAEWLLNAHAHSSVRDILRGPMLTHCNETDKTPSFIINTVNGPTFYSSDSQGRWKSETIYAPSQATHALSLVLISNSNIVPNSVDSLKLFPPTRLIWLDRDEERKLSLCIGQILPPSRKQIIPDLIQDIEGAVLEVIFLPFIVPMALISWTKSPLHGNADVGVNLYGLSAFQLHWTATFKFIDAISQCPIPPQSTNHLIGCFLIMNNHSNIDCYGVSSSSSENQYSVSHLLSSVVVHHPHLSPQLLANDSFLYLSESALIVYQWTNDITFLDSNYCLLPRTSTLMLVSNHSFNKQQDYNKVPVDFQIKSSHSPEKFSLFVSFSLWGIEYWSYDTSEHSLQVIAAVSMPDFIYDKLVVIVNPNQSLKLFGIERVSNQIHEILTGSYDSFQENYTLRGTQSPLTNYSNTPLSNGTIISLLEDQHNTLLMFTSDGTYDVRKIEF